MNETATLTLLIVAFSLGINLVTTCWIAAILNRTRRRP